MNENLKRVRETLGLQKQEMAKIFGISGSYYGFMEKGTRTLQPEFIKILVDEYNVRRDFIERGEMPIFKNEEHEATLHEFMKLNDEQKELVLQMIRQFNELNDLKK